MYWLGWITGLAFVLIAVVFFAQTPIMAALRRRQRATALQSFRLHREQLEAKFFELASQSGKPRGLRWLDCDWKDDFTLAFDNENGFLTAFAAVEIRFEAIEGGDMEEVQAVSRVREATAVFHFHNGHWGTGGRALFNMGPQDCLSRLEGQFTPLES